MKIKEQLQQSRTLARIYREAMSYLVLDRVKWFGPAVVTTVPGMPQRKLRVGVTQSADPLVILHNVDENEVFIVTPAELSHWPWHAMDAFPGLAQLLSDYVTILAH